MLETVLVYYWVGRGFELGRGGQHLVEKRWLGSWCGVWNILSLVIKISEKMAPNGQDLVNKINH